MAPDSRDPHSKEEFELVRLRSGVMSLREIGNQETFHPVTGPAIEAKVLYVDQQKLVERSDSSERFIIWDVGLGAAANATSALGALRSSSGSIEIHSFDRTTDPLRFALKNAESLGYLIGYEELVSELLEKRKVSLSSSLSWILHEGDFRSLCNAPEIPSPHAVLYDPYSRTTNPEMWTVENFRDLFNRLDPAQPCLLSNYTRSTAIRVSLLLAGFHVGFGVPTGEKGETTIATNSPALLERPLDQRWLERVKASRNSAPHRDAELGAPAQTISDEDFAQLLKHPQFRSSV